MKQLGVWGSWAPYFLKPPRPSYREQQKYLTDLGVDFYCPIIKDKEDVDDMTPFRDDFDLWPVLLPYSEGLSKPHNHHWALWALALKNYCDWVIIDDFNCGMNLELFDYPELNMLAKSLKLYLVVYERKFWREKQAEATDDWNHFKRQLDSLLATNSLRIHGLIVPWVDLCNTTRILRGIENVAKAYPQLDIVPLIYASGTSWHWKSPPRVEFKKALLNVWNSDLANKVILYSPPREGPLFNIIKEVKT